MVWNEVDCCEYVLLRLAQNTLVDDLRIEGWPVLFYARKHNYESLTKLMLEKNAYPHIEEREGEGEGDDFWKTEDEGEVGENVSSEVEGGFDRKRQWSEIIHLQKQLTEIETGLYKQLTEVKARLAVAKLEKNQVTKSLGGQIVELQSKIANVKNTNVRLKWEIADLKTAVGVVKYQKRKLEEKLFDEKYILNDRLQLALLELNKAQVVPQDEEKFPEIEEEPDCSSEVPSKAYKSDVEGYNLQPQGIKEFSIEHNLPYNIKPEPDIYLSNMRNLEEPSNYVLAEILSSKIDDLKNLFNDQRELAAANAKLKNKLVLQELTQNKKLKELIAKNHELEKLAKVAHDELTESKARNSESRDILVFASIIVENYLEVLAGGEHNHCHSKTLPANTYSRECLERLCDDIDKAQQSMIDVSEYETEREPFKQLSKNSSATTEDSIKGSSSHDFLLRKPSDDFQIKMPQNFKPSDREIEAVASCFLVQPVG